MTSEPHVRGRFETGHVAQQLNNSVNANPKPGVGGTPQPTASLPSAISLWSVLPACQSPFLFAFLFTFVCVLQWKTFIKRWLQIPSGSLSVVDLRLNVLFALPRMKGSLTSCMCKSSPSMFLDDSFLSLLTSVNAIVWNSQVCLEWRVFQQMGVGSQFLMPFSSRGP